MLELVRDGTHTLKLLVWDGREAKIVPQLEQDGQTYVVPNIDPTILRAVRFPTCIAPYGSTRQLFDEVCRLVTRLTDAAERLVLAVAYFTFGSWLADRVQVAPLLSVVAPVSAPTRTLCQLLHLLCRHPLLLGELTPSAFCTLRMDLGLTLLLDACELGPSTHRVLRASNRRGVFVPRNGLALDLYCAKAICTAEPLEDPYLASDAVEVALAPPRSPLPTLDTQESEKIADEFQAKFLMYRLVNYGQVEMPNFDVAMLTAPAQDLARALGASVVGDDKLQSGVLPLLRGQDEHLRLELSEGLPSVLIEALLFCSHDPNREEVRAAELADIVNTIWAGRGETRQVRPEAIGWKLRTCTLRLSAARAKGYGCPMGFVPISIN